MLLFCSILRMMINFPEVTANFIYKITIYMAFREVMLVNLICENNHEYKRLLAVCWHDKKRPTETMYSGETKINYFEDFIHLSHDVMILSLCISMPLKYSQKETTRLSWSISILRWVLSSRKYISFSLTSSLSYDPNFPFYAN